jgi:hypothetical protein
VTNCTGFNGVYTGLGFVSDTYNANDTLSLVFDNHTLGTWAVFEPIKQ